MDKGYKLHPNAREQEDANGLTIDITDVPSGSTVMEPVDADEAEKWRPMITFNSEDITPQPPPSE